MAHNEKLSVLVDTNILFSALLNPDGVVAKAAMHVADNAKLVLCEQNVQELLSIVSRKLPNRTAAAKEMLRDLNYELIPMVPYSGPAKIRDRTDQPILDAAIAYGVDIILTGDRDFLSLELSKPRCMSPSDYLEKMK